MGRGKYDRKSGGFTIDPGLKSPREFEKLVVPAHIVDEGATARERERLEEAVDGALKIFVDRKPLWTNWHGDISTDLGYLRGIEQILWDMMDRPQWFHELTAFMRDGVLKAHREAEEAGHWRLANHENQSMPYCRGVPDPVAEGPPVKREELWGFFAAQEFDPVSPGMHDEFLLQYQLPVMRHFRLISYGCCEDLTNKIDMLRQVPNLRRIAVSPFADVKRCAEQIGTDYIVSWRPSPAEMVAYDSNPEKIARVVREAREYFRVNNCRFDVCLKDVETVQGDASRLKTFTDVVRREVEEYWRGR